MIRLYHGTDIQSAQHILTNGLDRGKSARFNGGGEFWVTSIASSADYFARANPSGGTPVLLAFDLPDDLLPALAAATPAIVVDHEDSTWECFPPSFKAINRHMANCCIVTIP
jgi:hypothetical protein